MTNISYFLLSGFIGACGGFGLGVLVCNYYYLKGLTYFITEIKKTFNDSTIKLLNDLVIVGDK